MRRFAFFHAAILLGLFAVRAALAVNPGDVPDVGETRPSVADDASQPLATAGMDLVLYYPFAASGPLVHDHSERGNHARSMGVDITPDGPHGAVGLFNGHNAYLKTTTPVDLSPPYTVTAWVYLRSKIDTGGDFAFYRGRTLFSRGDLSRSGAWDYIFNVNAYGKLGFVTHASFSRADNLQNPEPFPLNRWVHVAFTHEGTTGRLYQDGRLVRQNAQLHAGNNHHGPGTFIGKIYNTHAPSAGDHFWDGMIQALRVYRRALSDGELEALQQTRPASPPPPAPAPSDPAPAPQVPLAGPVFHLAFDDGTCRDVGGREHHGEPHGAVPEPADGSMRLDGLGAHIRVPRHPDMSLGVEDNRSVLLWWKADLIDEQTQTLLSMRSARDNARGLAVELIQGRYVRLHLRYYHHADFPAPLEAGTWNHLAVVKEGTEWRIYHNGRRLTDPVLSRWPFRQHANAEVPLWIGRDQTGDRPFQGKIDEVIFFDRALSDTEVLHIHAQDRAWSAGPFPPAPPAATTPNPDAARAEPRPPAPRVGDPQPEPTGNPSQPIVTNLRAGELTVTVVREPGRRPHSGIEIELLPPAPGSQPLRGRTDKDGRATLRVPHGAHYQHLVRVGEHAVGVIAFHHLAEWTEFTLVMPEDYAGLPAGRPDLVPHIVAGQLVLTATRTPVTILPAPAEPRPPLDGPPPSGRLDDIL